MSITYRNELKKLTQKQRETIIQMENSCPQIYWQDIVVMEGWKQAMKVWEFWCTNIEPYLVEQ